MFKKILTLIMTLGLVFSLTACKEEDTVTKIQTEDVDSHFGNISENKYDNSYLGLSAEFAEDWIVYSEREILEYNDFSDDDVIKEEDVEEGTEFIEAVAYDFDSIDSIYLTSKKLKAEETVDTKSLANDNLAAKDEYYAAVEYTDIVSEVSTVDFLGGEKDCIKTNAVLDGDNVFIYVIYVESNGYLLTFDICSVDEAGADAILEAFELN